MSSHNIDRKNKYKLKESSKHRIWVFSERFSSPSIWRNIQLANTQPEQQGGGRKLHLQLKLKWTIGWHWTVKQENVDPVCSLDLFWKLKGSLPDSLPQYPSFPFSELQKVWTSSHSGHNYAKIQRVTEGYECKHSLTSFILARSIILVRF